MPAGETGRLVRMAGIPPVHCDSGEVAAWFRSPGGGAKGRARRGLKRGPPAAGKKIDEQPNRVGTTGGGPLIPRLRQRRRKNLGW